MRRLLALIGYLATATMISLAIGLGFAWQQGVLSNEKLFRMAALLYDIDLDRVGKENELVEYPVPNEEPSLAETQRSREVQIRDYEIKQVSLDRGREEFQHLIGQLRESTVRFDKLASELNSRIKQAGDLSTRENLTKVVRDLESVKPDTAKELLLKHLDQPEGFNDVMLLMGQMSGSKLKKVLERFQTPEELEALFKIHSLMLDGHPQKPILDKAMQMIKSNEANESI